jgi:hypothetical protein
VSSGRSCGRRAKRRKLGRSHLRSRGPERRQYGDGEETGAYEYGWISITELERYVPTELFMPAYRALVHTFLTVIREIASKYPKSRAGNLHTVVGTT